MEITRDNLLGKIRENYQDHTMVGIAQMYGENGWQPSPDRLRECELMDVVDAIAAGLNGRPAITGWQLRLCSPWGDIVEPDFYAREWIGRQAEDALRTPRTPGPATCVLLDDYETDAPGYAD